MHCLTASVTPLFTDDGKGDATEGAWPKLTLPVINRIPTHQGCDRILNDYHQSSGNKKTAGTGGYMLIIHGSSNFPIIFYFIGFPLSFIVNHGYFQF